MYRTNQRSLSPQAEPGSHLGLQRGMRVSPRPPLRPGRADVPARVLRAPRKPALGAASVSFRHPSRHPCAAGRFQGRRGQHLWA